LIVKDRNIAIGIGLHKSGTSWLYKQLEHHTQVNLLQRDTHVFSKYALEQDFLIQHLQQFSRDQKYLISIEMSNGYLVDEQALQGIKYSLPNAKIFLILRNPVERLISHYFQLKKIGDVSAGDTFQIFCENSTVKQIGKYKLHLEKLFAIFDQEQIHLMLFDDIVERPNQLLSDFYAFLSVDESEISEYIVHVKANPRRASKWVKLEQFQNDAYYKLRNHSVGKHLWYFAKKIKLGALIRKLNARPAEDVVIGDALERELYSCYQEDIDYIRSITNRPLLWSNK